MKHFVRKALHKANDYTSVKQVKRTFGGSINETYLIETHKGKYFIKYHPSPPEHFFTLEAKGLELIRSTNSISVPNVLAYNDSKNNSYLLLEWIEGKKSPNTDDELGDKIAKMHQTYGPSHGFKGDTYIGTLKQPNGLFSSWLEYYRDQRV